MVKLNYINLPESFFEEEDRYNYHISRLMKEVWAVQLDMLQLFKNICEKYEITWWIHGGTLLGAVRDGHYIPWDDDIDIVMPRREYEKLIDAWAKENIQDPYYFLVSTRQSDFPRHGRVVRLDTTMGEDIKKIGINKINTGILIGISIFDNLPDDENERIDFLKELTSAHNNSAAFYNCVTRYSNTETSHYIDGSVVNYDKNIYMEVVHPKSTYAETIMLKFEGIEVPAPKEYIKALDEMYFEKNWRTPMQLPSNHKLNFFDPSNSYKCYENIYNSNYISPNTVKEVLKINSLDKNETYTPSEINLKDTYTYDDITQWMSSLMHKEWRRHIDIIYVGNRLYTFKIKDEYGNILYDNLKKEYPLRIVKNMSCIKAIKTINYEVSN